MMKRFGLIKAKCIFCNYDCESSVHIFKDCWRFQALWQALNLDASHLNFHFSSFADWLYYLTQSLTKDDFTTALVAFWHTWYIGNLRVHGENGMDIYDSSVKIRSFIKRFQDCLSIYNVHSQTTYLTWRTPLIGFVKINCDATWQLNDFPSRIGVICRDHTGAILAAKSMVCFHVNNCLTAEGLALKEGMLLVMNLQLNKVIFETDSSLLADLIWFGKGSSESYQSHWHKFCSEEFLKHSEWHLSLIRREANEAADVAARYARDTGYSSFYVDVCPRFLGTSIQSVA